MMLHASEHQNLEMQTDFLGMLTDSGTLLYSLVCRLLLERRMRIVTVAVPVASTPAEVYAKADVDTLLAMLVHKIGQVVMQQGIEQGQGLLQDWLVLFVAAYNNHKGLQPRSPKEVCIHLHPSKPEHQHRP